MSRGLGDVYKRQPKRTDEAQRILEEAGIRVAGRMERENVP